MSSYIHRHASDEHFRFFNIVCAPSARPHFRFFNIVCAAVGFSSNAVTDVTVSEGLVGVIGLDSLTMPLVSPDFVKCAPLWRGAHRGAHLIPTGDRREANLFDDGVKECAPWALM